MMGITIPAFSQSLEYLRRRNELDLIQKQLQVALEMAIEEECSVITFGAHTSSLSNNATSLMIPKGASIKISSGNSFTAAVALQRLLCTAKEHGLGLDHPNIKRKVAVVGALGNIGRVFSEMLFVQNLSLSAALQKTTVI